MEVVASRLKAVLSDASSLLDFYYSIGGLVLIKVKMRSFCLHWSRAFRILTGGIDFPYLRYSGRLSASIFGAFSSQAN